MKRNFTRRIFLLLAVGLLILALGSCTVNISGGGSAIRVSNNSSYTIAHVYITDHNSSVWGVDLLYPSAIGPGGSVDFQVNPGNYDVQVIDTTLPPYAAIAYNVLVTNGNTTTLYFNGATLQ
jgi:hypothetical protein